MNAQKKIRATTIFFYLWSIIALFTFTKKIFSPNGQEIISPVPDIMVLAQHAPKTISRFSGLERLIAQNLESAPGTYGIVVKKLDTAETVAINDHIPFETASLYKLWVMGEVYRQVEKGTLTEDEVLSKSIPALNAAFGLSADVAEQTSGSISLSVKNALTQMITISHNYAALLLSAKIRMASVTSFLKDFNLTESKVGTSEANPKTTAADVAKFYELLYSGKLANSKHTADMFEMLKAQKINRKMPKYLPTGTVLAHKTGELGTYSHDAGILYTPKGDYIIVILSDYGIPADSEEFISKITKSIYDFLIES